MMDILTFALPAVLVLITAYVLIDKLLKNEDKRRDFELRKANISTMTPVRLRAYERLVLFLERTVPNAMIIGVIKPEMNCMDLHTKLLETIRQEFSHNISQQVYVSDSLWLAIRSAKESLTQLINTCAAHCNPAEPATVLAERIIQVYASSDETPSETALAKLKDEVKMYF